MPDRLTWKTSAPVNSGNPDSPRKPSKPKKRYCPAWPYVDLNPIRAGIATRPETSGYTSIQERIQPAFNLQSAITSQRQAGDLLEFKALLKPLLRFDASVANQSQQGIYLAFRDYLELVDWTGRMIRHDKRGFLDNALSPILSRLQISPKQWHLYTTRFEAIHARRFNRITPNIDTG